MEPENTSEADAPASTGMTVDPRDLGVAVPGAEGTSEADVAASSLDPGPEPPLGDSEADAPASTMTVDPRDLGVAEPGAEGTSEADAQ